MSNLHQIGLAALQYVQDYDETLFPWYEAFDSTTISFPQWDGSMNYATFTFHPDQGFLQPYMKSTQVEDCMTAAGLVPFTVHMPDGGLPVWAAYGTNMNLMPQQNGTYTGLSIAQVQAASDTVFMGDAMTVQSGGTQLERTKTLSPPSQSGGGTLNGRHTGFANVLWMDSHVKAVQPVVSTTATDSAAATRIANNIGDLVPPASVSSNQDYYFLLTKP